MSFPLSQESAGDHETSSSSGASSPLVEDLHELYQPKFLVKVTEPIKNGEVLQYTVKTTRVSDSCDFSVSRRYEDFEFLHHSLLTQNETDGVIMPPLPPKPNVEAKEAEQKSKKHLGPTAKTLIGDEFHKDCRSLEKYLRLVITHKVLGRYSCLESFLLHTQAPAGIKLKRGIIGKLLNAADEARKSNHVILFRVTLLLKELNCEQDIEEYFQKARTNANDSAAAVQQSSCAFNQVVHSQQRVSLAFAQLSAALKSCNATFDDEMDSEANKMLVKFGETIDDAKHGIDVEISNDENTLGFWLDLYARYSLSVKIVPIKQGLIQETGVVAAPDTTFAKFDVKEMLYRRTCLMIDYEESNRNLDKAKLGKKLQAEETKIAAEKAFEKCSEVAQHEVIISLAEVAQCELAAYDLQRRTTMQETLCVYADAKIKTARDTFALLARSLTYFKQADRAYNRDVHV